ncbi:ABC transporter ATP-binding protein [Microbacterium sp. NPDC058062]|uniref:ABC transporter ATP-binding protein n=1 Tax=Microbacterium sp. NPDC058062 TaxID=3346320 RepID=UPI0036D80C79
MSFGGTQALRGVDLTVAVGETVAVIGPNGAGKTSLFNCLTRSYRIDAGEIELDGESITAMPDFTVARRGVARTFQHPVLFPEMTVADNIGFGFDLTRPVGYFSALLRPGKVKSVADDRRRRVEEILDTVGLAAMAGVHAGELPQGHRRLVELGRALATNPKLLLLDEPVAGLNDRESEHFAELLRSVQEEAGISILLIEHDMPFVLGLADRVVVLNFGQVIATGSAAQIQTDPRVIEAYLGPSVES